MTTPMEDDVKEAAPPPQENTACIVCTERFTKLQRKPVVCPYCKKDACLNCQKGYLTSSVHDAHCMFCKVGWNDDFIRDNFTNNWLVKEYGKTEMECLWQREKSLLPASMVNVERTKLMQDFQVHYPIIQNQVHNLQRILDSLHQEFYNSRHRINARQIFPLIHQWNNLEAHKITLDPNVFDADRLLELFGSEAKLKDKRTITFHKPCPAPDCRGFLSTQWVCSLCSTKVCPNCHVIRRLRQQNDEEEHKCRDDDVATAEMIRKETKNCPKCAASITKIEGCDQMFCTSCNTPFSWKSLEIINRGIHNPHYFEWLNRQNRGEPQQQRQTQMEACPQGMPDAWSLANLLRPYFGSFKDHILNIQRNVLHIYGTRTNHVDNAQLNSTLRESYLMGNITEDKFKSAAYQRYKSNKFLQMKNQVIEMLHMAVTSILVELMQKAQRWPEIRVVEPPQATNRFFNMRRTTEPARFASAEYNDHFDETMQSLVDICLYYNKSISALHERYKKDSQFDIILIRNHDGNTYYSEVQVKTRKNV